jgi:hypothetical protein
MGVTHLDQLLVGPELSKEKTFEKKRTKLSRPGLTLCICTAGT